MEKKKHDQIECLEFEMKIVWQDYHHFRALLKIQLFLQEMHV